MIKYKINQILFFLIFLSQCSSLYVEENDISTKNPIIISYESYQKLQDYLNNKIYSYTYNTLEIHAAPQYFVLSESGQATSIGFCRDFNSFNCEDTLLESQLIQKCQNLNKESCRVIASKDIFIFDKKLTKLKYALNKKDTFFLIKNNSSKKNIHSSIMTQSIGNSGENWE